MPSIILSDNGVSSGSAGIKTSGSNDGTLALQTTTAAGTATTAQTIGTNQVTTFAQAANLPNTFGFKNRIINGRMEIDQRNAGASFTPTDGSYGLDRYLMSQTAAGKYTCQQNAGGVTPPVGFKYYMGMTSTSAYSVGSTDFFGIQQRIEGYNTNDLNWGDANAKDCSLSFWVRSSLTGTFGGAVRSGNFLLAYIFSYTITAANTWQYVTVSIPGPTTGTFDSSTGIGLSVLIAISSGSSYQDTPGSWLSGSSKLAPTGQTSVVGTNGATFYITGLQFEVGKAATSFDLRSITQELTLCQRYFFIINRLNTPAGGYSGNRILLPPSGNFRTTPTALITSCYALEDGAPQTAPTFVLNNNLGVGYSSNADYTRSNTAYSTYVQLSAEL